MKRYIYKMSHQATHLLKRTFAILLVAGAFASCADTSEDSGAPSTGNAYISLNFSTSQATTSRAGDDGLKDNETAANPTSESDINSIRVWVFSSDNGDSDKPIAYQNKTAITKTDDGKYTLNIKFLGKIQNKEVSSIDLYILANAETITSGLNSADITRKDLKDALYNAPFGIKDGGPETQSVPTTGLPISRAITGITVKEHCADTETGAAQKSINIPLVRAVSKLHFFFARKTDGNTDQVKVTKIVVDGNIIPSSSYVFPDEEQYNSSLSNQDATHTYDTNTSYVSSTLQLGGVENSKITAVENPLDYCKKTDETAMTYMTRLATAKINSQDLCYLRETNKAISGTIYYQLSSNGTEKSATFNIPSEEGKAAIRNRELVVYGYFQKGEMGTLSILPTVVDWNDGGTYNYIEKASSDITIDDGKKGDYGYQVYYGEPKKGPMITLKNIDTDGKTWILQTNNPMFGFVECDANGNYEEKEPVYSTDITQQDGSQIIGHTYKIQDYIKRDPSNKDPLYFYVVPKKRLDTSLPHNAHGSVFITKNPHDLFYINVDQKFPGTATEIYFEQVL